MKNEKLFFFLCAPCGEKNMKSTNKQITKINIKKKNCIFAFQIKNIDE